MKLARYGARHHEKPALVDTAGQLRSLEGIIDDITPEVLRPENLDALRKINPDSLPIVEGSPRLGVPIKGIGKVVAIGLNYSDHALESGLDIPEEPVVFSKAITSLHGPDDVVVMPKDSTASDWEVELAIVIGSPARNVAEDAAENCIAGYALANDVSERDWQWNHGGTWDKGKGFDTYLPLGPWVVTSDEVGDPQSLDIWLEVNGKRMQNGNTDTMIFTCKTIVSYVSNLMTLMPGDVIITGTPPGVGMGIKPDPVYLKDGDVMRLGITGLGEQQQTVRAFDPALLPEIE